MKWKTTYSENEVGSDFIKRYGWFDLIGPNGPFYMNNTRIMIGYWGENLNYQMHWHLAEEAYVPLDGSALFWSEYNGKRLLVLVILWSINQMKNIGQNWLMVFS